MRGQDAVRHIGPARRIGRFLRIDVKRRAAQPAGAQKVNEIRWIVGVEQVLTARQMREADRRTIEDLGVPSLELMENAGRGAFEALVERFAADLGRVVVPTLLSVAARDTTTPPEVDADRLREGNLVELLLKPFATSQTARNLASTPEGVFQTTDDVLLLARTVVGAGPAPALVPELSAATPSPVPTQIPHVPLLPVSSSPRESQFFDGVPS